MNDFQFGIYKEALKLFCAFQASTEGDVSFEHCLNLALENFRAAKKFFEDDEEDINEKSV